VWISLPIKIELSAFAKPTLPIAMLLFPVMLRPAVAPKAILPDPLLFPTSALEPTAVLLPPVVLLRSARVPMAVLTLPPVGTIAYEGWNSYSQVLALEPKGPGEPFYWGIEKIPTDFKVTTIGMSIDSAAGTTMTQWGGDPKDLGWIPYDVTSLPYHLRKGGDAAVIGVGGGRDLLTALWGNSKSVLGVELNSIFVALLEGPYRKFSGIADRPNVHLVADEARSYLTRTPQRFDVLQMSLIDTWASTGAGAFTLSENGLYTIEAWKVFRGVLKPDGIFSVSRWFSPSKVSETSRLLALGTAALLGHGITDPAAHLALVSLGNVATLMVSLEPLTPSDLAAIDAAASGYGFHKIAVPGMPPELPLFREILASGSIEALGDLLRTEPFDYSPPTDRRPYFFNMLKPSTLLSGERLRAFASSYSSMRLGTQRGARRRKRFEGLRSLRRLSLPALP